MAKITRDAEALKKLIAEYNAWWQKDIQKAINTLYKEIEKGNTADAALKIVEKKYPDVFKLPDMEDTLVKAAAYGYGIMPSVMAAADSKAIAKELTKAWSGDQLTLAKKIHGTSVRMHKAIVSTIKQQIKANSTWITTARALYDGYGYGKVIKHQQIADYMRLVRKASGNSAEVMALSRKALYNINRLSQNGAPNKALKAAYTQLVEAAQKGSQEALKNAVKVAIAEKSRYAAERLARTELAKAWADGFLARTMFDDDIVGYKWKLSSRHPVFDICDMYAKADMFGLGAGIYPKDKIPPLPAHPHCLCRMVEVFRGEVNLSDETDNTQAEGDKWLKQLPVDKQEAVLGIAGRKAWREGDDWREYMRGWEGLSNPESRLTRSLLSLQKYDDSAIMNLIKSDLQPKTILPGQQNKHIVGTHEYKQYVKKFQEKNQYGPSYLTINMSEMQALVDKYHGTGIIDNRKNNFVETVVSNNLIIGSVVNNLTGKTAETTVFKIHYGAKGVHIVPDYPNKKGE